MYHFVYGLLYLISLLPMGVIHAISSSIAWLVGSVIGYRRKVVMANLAIAFPEKTEKERVLPELHRCHAREHQAAQHE